MPPSAIVHIGSNKAGSTTLQRGLFTRRDALKAQGILVPDHGGARLNELYLAKMFSQSARDDTTDRHLAQIAQEARESGARHVVFSSEYLHRVDGAAADLQAILGAHFDDIRPVLYLREPLGFYLSYLQQRYKSTHEAEPPTQWHAGYRRFIAPWRAQFGANLTLLPFQPSCFPNGMIEDFLTRFAGLAPDPNAPPERRENVSETGEVSFLMQGYFRANPAPEARPAANRLRAQLSAVARQEGLGRKPALRPEIRDLLLARHRDDLFWLRDAEGIAFDAIAYDALAQCHAPERLGPLERFDQIAQIDQDQAQRIMMTALGLSLDAQAQSAKELERLRQDAAARRSRLAVRIERWDYQLHRGLARLPFASAGFRARMDAAAEKRRRPGYRR